MMSNDLDSYFAEDTSMVEQQSSNNQNYGNNNSNYNQNNYQGNNNSNNNNQNYNNNSNYNNKPNNGYNNNKGYNNNGGYQKKSYGGKYQEQEVDLTNFKLYKPYSVVATKDAPRDVLDTLRNLVTMMKANGFTLRASTSTDMDDVAITTVQDSSTEVYIPWKDFNNVSSKYYFNDKTCLHIAKMFHRSFDSLKPAVQAFLGRTVRMIMGKKPSNYSLFIVVWSEDGAEKVSQITPKTGYISHAISVADALHIPVFNLQNNNAIDRIRNHFSLK